MSTTPPPPVAGVRAPIGVVAHYNLLERLEPAGPGELFRARDTRRGRTVSLRWMPAHLAPTPEARAALIAEARGTLALSHPNVITLFDVGEHEGRVYLAFEHLQGHSLRREIRDRSLSVRRSVEVAVQVGDAVAAAHGLGFAHGGLSPDSVSVTARGHAKVPAFALAAHGGFVSDGELRDYTAPEEQEGQAPDDRSDVYSVGAMLFEMLTGQVPNPKGSAAPSAANPQVPPALDELVLRAVHPRPEHRPQMPEFVAALRALLPALELRAAADEHGVEARGPSPGRMAAIVFAVAAAMLAWWFLR